MNIFIPASNCLNGYLIANYFSFAYSIRTIMKHDFSNVKLLQSHSNYKLKLQILNMNAQNHHRDKIIFVYILLPRIIVSLLLPLQSWLILISISALPLCGSFSHGHGWLQVCYVSEDNIKIVILFSGSHTGMCHQMIAICTFCNFFLTIYKILPFQQIWISS